VKVVLQSSAKRRREVAEAAITFVLLPLPLRLSVALILRQADEIIG
jgi:hypothetical protein